MRLTFQFLPTLLLSLLLPISLFYQITFFKLLILTVFLILLRTLLVIVQVRSRRNDARVILETISISHYVEKVRWAMDYLEIQYEEEENVGILGLLLQGRLVPQLKIPGKGIYIENSSDILRYLLGKYFQNQAMADFLRPTAEMLKLETKFDILGEDLRRFIYFNMFNSENTKEFQEMAWGLWQPNIPTWQKYLLKIISPLFRIIVSQNLKVTREESIKSMKNAEKVFEEMNELLSDGREFLMGTPAPTYIDFHLCSMTALLLQPPNYSGEICSVGTKAVMNKLPQQFLEQREKLEKTLLGKYVLKIYSKFRLNTITKTSKTL